MRAAILGPLSFLIVPVLLWPPDMLAVQTFNGLNLMTPPAAD